MSDRVLPHNLEAERSVLGAILVHNEAFNSASEVLDSRDFYRDAHRRIFERMIALSERNQAIDFITLTDELARRGDLDEVGGPAFIASLVDGVPRATNVEYYARIVKEKATLRNLIYAASKILTDAYEGHRDAAEIGANAGRDLGAIVAEVAGTALPPIEALSTRLARPVERLLFRIEGWLPRGGRVLLAAQFKSGKTTMVANAIRALVDGEPFLDRDPVRAITGTVALLDFEMSDSQLDSWLRAQGIRATHRVAVASLRGRASTFDILRPEVRARWAAALKACETEILILDCLRPVLDALGLDEHHDAGRFLVAFDALLAEAGISEAILVHHMGHQAERARGDSRLLDWPDVSWRLMRANDDPASARFLTAYGRDVDQPEQRLDFDPQTRRLRLAGGSRRDVKAEAALEAVLAVLADTGQLSGRAIKNRLRESDHGRDALDGCLKYGVQTGALSKVGGPGRAFLYSRVSVCPEVSDQCPPDAAPGCPDASIHPDTRTHPAWAAKTREQPDTQTAGGSHVNAGRF